MRRAVLLVSHGSVDSPEDLAAFVANIRRGRPPSEELLAELGRRYRAIGGKSPINEVTARVARKLEAVLRVPVAWANRLWKPYVREVLADLARSGTQQVVLVPLAQHSAHVYEADARRALEGTGLALTAAASWGDRPALHAAFARRIAQALASAPRDGGQSVVMTAHSLPQVVVDRGDPYEKEVRAAAAAIAAALRERTGQEIGHFLSFQSQGLSDLGPDGKPLAWLGPDVRSALDAVVARGDRGVVFAPIGFLSDHIEVLYDLDIEARGLAEARGLSYARAASLNADDDFIEVLADVARPLLADG